jgi:Uma2 family endonuclease
MQLPKEAERYRWSDYLAWAEGERYKLIDGIAYAMSPAPRRRHQEIAGEMFRQAANALREWIGRPSAQVRPLRAFRREALHLPVA